jgi:Phospholipase_D-nuclease N-terminal
VVVGIGLLGVGGVALGVVALVLGVAAIVSVLRNPDFSGGAKALWVIAIVLFPILGGAVYFGVRGDW